MLIRDLAGHERQPSAFLLYFYLWWRTQDGAGAAELSLQELSDQTGLSKRAIQEARRLLVRRRLLAVSRPGQTKVTTYRILRPWLRA